ncbi:ATP dependent DNA ligase [Rhodococcus erythropolis]
MQSRCRSKRPGFARENPRIACIRCNSTGFFGSLLYIGSVGTGFSSRLRGELRDQLLEIERPTSPFAIVPPRAIAREARWAEPLLVCDVEYREYTGSGLRHPAFKGLRVDKTADEVTLPGRH